MASVYTVGQINAYIKNMFEQDFLLERVSIKGEVSNCKYHSSGHIYFSLKDAAGVIRCVMFAGNRVKGLNFQLENGQKIVASGQISVYERDGSYQLYARSIRKEGLGELYERYEQLKSELEDMGMFAPEYKKPIPKYAKTIGVVTAPTGAAVRDIIQISTRRNPGVQIVLYPAKVQGEGAAESVCRGIMALDSYGVDVIIAGRGGGSIEDLWAFNEEIVAKAIFACNTPVISAVGHETDTVISDYVADLRAPTPSAAAELAVTDMFEVVRHLKDEANAVNSAMLTVIDQKRQKLERMQLKLKLSSPQGKLNTMHQDLAGLTQRLEHAMKTKLMTEKNRVLVYKEKLAGLSPLAKLEGGYAMLLNEDGSRVSKASQLKANQQVKICFADGVASATVNSVDVKHNDGE